MQPDSRWSWLWVDGFFLVFKFHKNSQEVSIFQLCWELCSCFAWTGEDIEVSSYITCLSAHLYVFTSESCTFFAPCDVRTCSAWTPPPGAASLKKTHDGFSLTAHAWIHILKMGCKESGSLWLHADHQKIVFTSALNTTSTLTDATTSSVVGTEKYPRAGAGLGLVDRIISTTPRARYLEAVSRTDPWECSPVKSCWQTVKAVRRTKK